MSVKVSSIGLKGLEGYLVQEEVQVKQRKRKFFITVCLFFRGLKQKNRPMFSCGD
jgi:hypothetical protein